MTNLKLGSRGNDVKIIQSALNLYPDGIFGPLTLEGVIDFQTKNGLNPDGIVGPKTRAALGVLTTSTTRHISKIILHCTATPEGKDYTIDQIRQWHLARGFSDIGYHFVVDRYGKIHLGRPLNIAGAHTSGHNSNSIGISYIGGCASDGKTPKDTRTPQQTAALHKLVNELRAKFPTASRHGHYEFANKACPSFKICDF